MAERDLSMLEPLILVAAVTSLLLAVSACGNRTTSGGYQQASPAEKSPGQVTQQVTVQTYLREWSVRADPSSVKAAPVTFMAHNEGTMHHELVVIKTTLAPDKLPVGDDSAVVEGGPVEVIGEIEPDELSPSATASKTMQLEAGSYVLICNIAGHYSSGMHTAFTVTT
jgi:uncharacterized cupredoxin-like copper-binding protein